MAQELWQSFCRAAWNALAIFGAACLIAVLAASYGYIQVRGIKVKSNTSEVTCGSCKKGENK